MNNDNRAAAVPGQAKGGGADAQADSAAARPSLAQPDLDRLRTEVAHLAQYLPIDQSCASGGPHEESPSRR